ncbi:MAG: Segregation and condensation protein [Myxococcaceae bacterium]|nr:Segregation and condensation protein [Myxococcaceae bacterium]
MKARVGRGPPAQLFGAGVGPAGLLCTRRRGYARGVQNTSLEEVAEKPKELVFRLEVTGFEGPLDLLLHLIQEHELDILDLPMAFVCQRYLAYLDTMKQLALDVVSEYLVMAATLTHIKSKMLLPAPPVDQDDDGLEFEGDPREELVRRLLEYQKYKAAAENLAGRGLAGRDVFTRGAPAEKAEGQLPLGGMTLFHLLDAFNKVLKRANADFSREITAERVTIQDRIQEIIDLLLEKRRLTFDELFEGYLTNYDIVVTFLAMLEMGKQNLVRVYQNEPYAPIYLESAVIPSSPYMSDVVPAGTHLDYEGLLGEELGSSYGDELPRDVTTLAHPGTRLDTDDE